MPLASEIAIPVTDVIHGVRVVDPYRWLEDRSKCETAEWIRNQGLRCDACFAHVAELGSSSRSGQKPSESRSHRSAGKTQN